MVLVLVLLRSHGDCLPNESTSVAQKVNGDDEDQEGVHQQIAGSQGAMQRVVQYCGGFGVDLLHRVPQSRVNGGGAPRTPNTTNLVFPGVEGEALLIALDLKGLACSTGAACSSGAVEPSHVLTAIGLPPEEARASLRFSLGRHTTSADIDFALNVVPAAVAQLRELSPTYQKAVAHE